MNLGEPIHIKGVDDDWGKKDFLGTLLFLAMPGALLVLNNVLGFKLPTIVLYGAATIIGGVLFIRSLSNPEWLIAVVLLYFPLSKMMVIPIAPGINGTNLLFLLMGISLVLVSSRDGTSMFVRRPGSRLVAWLTVFTLISGVTICLQPGGADYLFNDVLLEFKAMLDQFAYYFLILNLIRDGKMARRMIIYMILSGLLVAALGTDEMVDKMGRSSIEKSRVDGPHGQPNDFGAFLVYSLMPLVAVFLMNITRIKSWLLAPYFAIALKLLLTTFSRGAYLALAASSLAAGYLKGKMFLFSAGVFAVALLVAMPSLIPSSLMSRIDNTSRGDRHGEQLDSSSEMRLVLWRAAVKVTLERPVLGAGFLAFPKIKSQYTEVPVRVGDAHNQYLWFCSQSGLPSMFIFLALLWTMYKLGRDVHRWHPLHFAKTIGVAGSGIAVAAAVINMFGSRTTNLAVTCFFWAMLAVLAHLYAEIAQERDEQQTIER